MEKRKLITIPKGEHYSDDGYFSGFFFGSEISGTFKAVDWVDFKLRNSDDKDTNKIIGFSDSFSHKKHSVRIGWRLNKHNELLMVAFYHVNGTYIHSDLGYFDPEKEYEFRIKVSKNHYHVWVGDYFDYLPRHSKYWFLRYIIPPYYGGDNTAPHDIKFDVKLKYKIFGKLFVR